MASGVTIIVVVFLIVVFIVTAVLIYYFALRPKNHCDSCPTGTTCQNGQCTPINNNGCTANSDCPTGSVCQNGQCTCSDANIYSRQCLANGSLVILNSYNQQIVDQQALGICEIYKTRLSTIYMGVVGETDPSVWIVELDNTNTHIAFKSQATGGYLQVSTDHPNDYMLVGNNIKGNKWFQMNIVESDAAYVTFTSTQSLQNLGVQSVNISPFNCNGSTTVNGVTSTFASTDTAAWWQIATYNG